MDSLIAAAARALATGDPLGALQRVALRDDPPALALRGIAMAQLGEHGRARELLRRAASGFGPEEALAQARCVVAEAEIALATRDLAESPRHLAAATATLEARGDVANAAHARLIAARRLLRIGRLDEARAALAQVEAGALTPALATVAALLSAELDLRALRVGPARAALARARTTAVRSGVLALIAEAAEAHAMLDRPAARLQKPDGEHLLRLEDVAALFGGGVLVVDACRHALRRGDEILSLARRPVLFVLARALAQAWPRDVARDVLIARVFRTRRPDETHRARLRVEIGRLRALARPFAGIDATACGFVLRPNDGRAVAVLAPPIDGDQASLLALLADGAAWSTSALALASGASQRTVQRALAELEAEARVRAIGQARSRRWLAPPLAGFATILLLPDALPPA